MGAHGNLYSHLSAGPNSVLTFQQSLRHGNFCKNADRSDDGRLVWLDGLFVDSARWSRSLPPPFPSILGVLMHWLARQELLDRNQPEIASQDHLLWRVLEGFGNRMLEPLFPLAATVEAESLRVLLRPPAGLED